MSGADHPTPAAAPGGVDPAGTETVPVSRRAAMELRLLALERSLASGGRPDVSEVLDDLLAAYGGGPEARVAAADPRGASPRPWLIGACALLLGAVGTVVAFSAGPERPAAVADPPRLILHAGRPMAARGGAGTEGGSPRRQEAAAGSAERASARGREVCVYRGAAERSCSMFE